MALNSETTIKVVDLLCEGPIEGLVRNTHSVFLDETSAADKEVKSIDFSFRAGTQSQTPFDDNFGDGVTTVIAVDTQVGRNYSEELNDENLVNKRDYGEGSVVRTITDTETEFVKLLFTVPKLFSQAVEGIARGQLFPAKLRLEIDIFGKTRRYGVTINGQRFKDFEGISTSDYQFETPEIKLHGEGPWKIRVKKRTFDPPESAFQVRFTDLRDVPSKTPLASGRGDTVIWTSIIAGRNIRTAYRHTACVALNLSTEQFGSLPQRAYEVKGMKVRIPSNASPNADGRLIFSGSFNGKLRPGRFYTTCPVCCFYDMLTNDRYGAGDFVPPRYISWVDLIELSRYSNDLITNPDGTREPRFAINTVIGNAADAYSVLQDLASIFRGMLYWKSDMVQIAADHGTRSSNRVPLDPVHIFTNSNVVGGGFSYSGSSLKTRSTRVRVRYNDPENFYRPNSVVIENNELVQKYGFQIRDIVAFGCTSKFQAQRMGKWVMASEETEGETVSFSVGLEGLMVMPGQVFAVSDAMRQGARLAGRVASSTTTSVTGDEQITLPAGSDRKLTCVLSDGTVETRGITDTQGRIITVSPAFSSAPQVNTVYSIESIHVQHQKFRCLTITEGDDGVYGIVGVQHVDNIYEVVENENALLEFADITTFDRPPPAPQDLKLVANEITKEDGVGNRIFASWSRGNSITAVFFEIKYRIGAGNFKDARTNNTNFEIDGIPAGVEIDFRVRSVGPEPRAKRSPYTTAKFVVPAVSTKTSFNSNVATPEAQVLPPDPTNVSATPIGRDQINLVWTIENTGANIEGLRAVIRHTADLTANASWPNSTLFRSVPATQGSVILPLVNGTYFIKFETIYGLRSKNAVGVTINLPDAIPRFNFEVIREDQNAHEPKEYLGEGHGVYYDSEYDGLILDGDARIDDIAGNFDDLASVDFVGTRSTSGVYHFAKTFDLGGRFSVDLKRVIESRGLYPLDLIDDRTELIDSWSDFDGFLADDTTTDLYFRSSNDATAASYFLTEDDNHLLFGDTVFPDQDLVTQAGDTLITESGDTVQTNQTTGGFDEFLQAQDGDQLITQDGSLLVNNELIVPAATGDDKIFHDSNLVFGDWIPVENGNFVGRQFQFKAELRALHPDQTPIVDKLGATIQLERRTENGPIDQSGTDGTGKDVVFENAFYTDDNTKVAVMVTSYDMATGDVAIVTPATASGFNVTFQNSSGVVVDRQFQYTAVGFGTKQD
tara:strand:- start:4683 stop:8372 length:3690 start_codon:yes stop_codon:yes gene_type:complete